MPSNQNASQTPPVAAPVTPTALDPQAVNLSKAIRQEESGGDFARRGKSGEYGAYQFLPDTWTQYSKEAGISNVPLEKATAEQQNEVAYKKIKQWKDAGYNVGQIASMWNAGPGKPNAYVEGNKGTNAQGVQYDTGAYAQRVAQAYQHFKGTESAPAGQTPPTGMTAEQNQPAPQQGGGIGDLVGKAADFAFPIAGDISNLVQGKNTKGLGQLAGDALLSGSWFIPGAGILRGAGAAVKGAEAAGVVGDMLAQNAAGKVLPGLGEKLAASAAPKTGMLPSLLNNPIAKGAAMGYTQDVGSKLSQGEDLGSSVTPGLGTAIGAGLGGAGGVLGKILDAFPTRVAQGALKLDPATAQYALENRGLGTTAKLSRDTEAARSSLSGQINDILGNEKYAANMGRGNAALKDAASSYTSGSVKAADIMKNAQNLLGKPYLGLLTKLQKGTATLTEKNMIRSALDSATRSVYREGISRPTEAKNLGTALADALREEVKTTAPETGELFGNLQKEVVLGQALRKLTRRPPGNVIDMRSLLSGLFGSGLGGLPGAATAIGMEKMLTSPAGQFALAKGAKAITPTIKAGGTITKLLGARAGAASQTPTQ